MNKRALMLTAAVTALLSGHAYGASPCATSPETSGANCDLQTAYSYPIYTGTVPPAVTTANSAITSSNTSNGSLLIDTNGSLTVGISPPLAPALTINSGTAANPTLVTNTATISYQGITYATGVLLEESSVATTTTGYGNQEFWTGEYYASGTGILNMLGAGTNKTAILIAGGAYPGAGLTNSETGTYATNTGTNSGLGLFTGATGLEPSGSTSPVAIYLAPGSITEVQGTSSIGINLIGPSYSAVGTPSVITPAGGASLLGDIDVGGSLLMTPTTVGSTASTGNVAINIAGWEQTAAQPYNPAFDNATLPDGVTPLPNRTTLPYAMVGNLNILTGGVVSSEGAGAQGVVVLGAINGAITNYGTIETFGTTAPSTALNAADPEGAQALVIANNVTGGVYNAGPTAQSGGSSVAAGIISMNGDQETIDIAPAFNDGGAYTVPVTIGGYAESSTGYDYSLFNRGSISAAGEDANISPTTIVLTGLNGAPVTLTNGIFNSGTIQASSGTNANAAPGVTTATAINIGNYVTVGAAGNISGTNYGGATAAAIAANGGVGYSLVNSNETGKGTISASVSGSHSGTAYGIFIQASQTGAPSAAGSLPSLFNSGTISASSSTTDLDDSTIAAYAIEDKSGTLTNIYNTGTISATTTTLNNNEQTAIAIDVRDNTTSSVTINDVSNGTSNADIVGDIHFGTQQSTLSIVGTSTTAEAFVAGNLYFSNSSGTVDALTIGRYGTFSGEINQTPGALMDIIVGTSGAPNAVLDLLTSLPTNVNSTVTSAATANTPVNVRNLTVSTGSSLSIALSQGNNVNAFAGSNVTVINAQNINIGGDGVTPTLALTFGGYVASPSVSGKAAEFVLLSTPSTGTFDITPQELNLLVNTYDSAANPSTATANGIPYLFASSICTYNVAAAAGVTTTNGTPAACSTGSGPYNPTNQELVLTLTPKTIGTGAGQIPLTGYAAKMFPYVNQALVNDNTLGAAMVTDIKDAASAQAAYAAYAPDVSGATRATAISLTDSATNVVAARQRELRMYANQEGATTLWGQQFAERLSQANSSTLTGYNDSGFGFVLGMDDGDAVDGRYGGAFTFFTGGMSQKEPTSAKTSSEYYMLTGYTDWRGKGLFLDTQGTVGYANLKGNRYITLTNPTTLVTTSRDAQSQRASELLAGSITMGGIFTAGSTVFMPQVDVDGLTMREEGYTEGNGGQGFDLRVEPYYADSLRAFLGADMRQDFNFGDFYLQPELRAGYRYDFVDGMVKLKASFASVGTLNGQTYTPFSIEGPDPGRGNLVLGGGIATTTGAWSIGINYDYVKASSGPAEQTGVLTLIGRI